MPPGAPPPGYAGRPGPPSAAGVGLTYVLGGIPEAAAAVTSVSHSLGGVPVGLVLADARPDWSQAEFTASITVAWQAHGGTLGAARFLWFLEHKQLPAALASCASFGMESELITWVQPAPECAAQGLLPCTTQLLVAWCPASGGSLLNAGHQCGSALFFARLPEEERVRYATGWPVDDAQKPVDLLVSLLGLFASRHQLVVDLTCGAGTTAVSPPLSPPKLHAEA